MFRCGCAPPPSLAWTIQSMHTHAHAHAHAYSAQCSTSRGAPTTASRKLARCSHTVPQAVPAGAARLQRPRRHERLLREDLPPQPQLQARAHLDNALALCVLLLDGLAHDRHILRHSHAQRAWW